MQYSLLIYQTDSQFAARSDPARRDAANGAFMRYVEALQEAGVLLVTWSSCARLASCRSHNEHHPHQHETGRRQQ